MNSFVKRTEKGEKYFLKWNDIEIGEYTGFGNPQINKNKIKAQIFKKDSLYIFLKIDITLNSLIMYEGL